MRTNGQAKEELQQRLSHLREAFAESTGRGVRDTETEEQIAELEQQIDRLG